MKWCTKAACQRFILAICIKKNLVSLETATAFRSRGGSRTDSERRISRRFAGSRFPGLVVGCRIKLGDTSLGFASCSRYCITVCCLEIGGLTCLLNMSASIRSPTGHRSCGQVFGNVCYHSDRNLLKNRHLVGNVASNSRVSHCPGSLAAAGFEASSCLLCSASFGRVARLVHKLDMSLKVISPHERSAAKRAMLVSDLAVDSCNMSFEVGV